VPIQPKGDLPPLFCVAGLGGNTLNLLPLAMAMGPRQPFYGLQHRGVDGVLAPHRTIQAMAREFVNDIRKVQARGPYYLAGYSAGGLAAYEMASCLRERGETVGLLILLDTYNPLVSKWAWNRRIQAHWERFKGVGGAYLWWRAVRSTKAKVETLRRMIRARLAEVNRFEYRMDAVIEATHEAERRYVPPKLDVPVSLLQTDFAVPAAEGIGYPLHESNGWRDYVLGKLEISVVRCQHEALVSERVAPITASIIRKALRTERQADEYSPVSVSPVRFNSHKNPYYEPPPNDVD
jgi:thioesterase domain-containing protein